MSALLEIDDLRVRFGTTEALRGVSLRLGRGVRIGIVGESGSGKSTLGLAILDLLAPGASVTGQARLEGAALPWGDDRAMTAIRGRRIGFVHQDPMSAFSPVHRIGTHLIRAWCAARPGDSRADARRGVIALLDEVEITRAAARLDHYPHEYSGGMRQRVMVAAALVGDPALLIADEPTTALDVTTQAAVLAMIARVAAARSMSVMLVTHDLGIVTGTCDAVTVMYGGKVMQSGALDAVLADPHPYTAALLAARPRPGLHGQRLPTIADMLPEGWADA